jgi:ABC-2 type transport system ATP-binding protein
VRDVVCRFGAKLALDRVDLTVRPGEIHALLGPNGAGKTTLIRVLSGLVEPQSGSVTRSGTVGLVPSGDRSFYMRISTLENLIFFARLQGLRLRPAKRRSRELLEQVGLGDVAARPVGRCSHGMQKRLAVARALLVEPQILLVDEATHDLDPEGARRVQGLIRDLAATGVAIVWTTQRVDEVRGFAYSMTFLRAGTVGFTGSPSELAAQAPPQRYVIQVRERDTQAAPRTAALQLAAGAGCAVSDPVDAQDEFLITADGEGALGRTVARLVGAGFDVLACRHEHSELEQAFLHLAGQVAA